jgi:hypothetical protein
LPKLKSQFCTQGPNFWDSICQVWLPIPKYQIKRHGEDRERRLFHSSGHAVGRGSAYS